MQKYSNKNAEKNSKQKLETETRNKNHRQKLLDDEKGA